MIERTSGAVVYRRNNQQIEYLLLQSQNPGHFWGFPKGHVEGDEDLVTTATREIQEETQLQVNVDATYAVQTEYDLPNGNQKTLTLFTAQVPATETIDLQTVEIKDAVWLPYEAARRRLTYDNLKDLLAQVNAHLMERN